MPYYTGDYYRGDYYRGDNYGAYQAGGILGSIGKAIGGVVKGVAKVAGGVLGATPVGQVVKAAIPSIAPSPIPQITGFAPPVLIPKPGIQGFAERLVPGGQSGYMVAKRRRINPLNIKALRRAMRRAKGFEKQARRVGSFFNPGKTYRLKGRRPRKA